MKFRSLFGFFQCNKEPWWLIFTIPYLSYVSIIDAVDIELLLFAEHSEGKLLILELFMSCLYHL